MPILRRFCLRARRAPRKGMTPAGENDRHVVVYFKPSIWRYSFFC